MLLWSRPRRRFGDFAAAGKVTRRPQAAKSPCKKRNCSIIAPSSVWPDGQPPSPQGEGSLRGSGPHPPQRESLQRQAAKHSFAQNSFAYFSSKKSKSVVQFAS